MAAIKRDRRGRFSHLSAAEEDALRDQQSRAQLRRQLQDLDRRDRAVEDRWHREQSITRRRSERTPIRKVIGQKDRPGDTARDTCSRWPEYRGILRDVPGPVVHQTAGLWR
jgi:hypothetical protein